MKSLHSNKFAILYIFCSPQYTMGKRVKKKLNGTSMLDVLMSAQQCLTNSTSLSKIVHFFSAKWLIVLSSCSSLVVFDAMGWHLISLCLLCVKIRTPEPVSHGCRRERIYAKRCIVNITLLSICSYKTYNIRLEKLRISLFVYVCTYASLENCRFY